MSLIVLKFGTGVLAHPGGRALNSAQFRRLSSDFAALMKKGHQVVVVSSAAIAAGVHALGLKSRPEDLSGKQACAAAGQPELMRLYSASFKKHGLRAAQLLLSHGDIDSRQRRTNAQSTLRKLLSVPSMIPIINENDSVAVEELRFGDNDRLSAEVAMLIDADHLVICTSADGLQDSSGKRISIVRDIADAFRHVRPEKGSFSVGGMQTKLEAVQLAVGGGIPATIIDGHKPDQIAAAVARRDVGTRFPVPKTLS